jgi:hypothetical protein
VVFQLVAFGVTVSELRSTVPRPKADGLECTVAFAPRVSLPAHELAWALAGPLLCWWRLRPPSWTPCRCRSP